MIDWYVISVNHQYFDFIGNTRIEEKIIHRLISRHLISRFQVKSRRCVLSFSAWFYIIRTFLNWILWKPCLAVSFTTYYDFLSNTSPFRGQHFTKFTTSASTENFTLIIIRSVLSERYMTHCVCCNSGLRKDRNGFALLFTCAHSTASQPNCLKIQKMLIMK